MNPIIVADWNSNAKFLKWKKHFNKKIWRVIFKSIKTQTVIWGTGYLNEWEWIEIW